MLKRIYIWHVPNILRGCYFNLTYFKHTTNWYHYSTFTVKKSQLPHAHRRHHLERSAREKQVSRRDQTHPSLGAHSRYLSY